MDTFCWLRLSCLSLICTFASGWAIADDSPGGAATTPALSALKAVASSVGDVVPWRPLVGQVERKWTEAASGRTAQGQLLAANEKSARIRRADGKVVTIALARLSADDRKFVDDATRILPSIAAAVGSQSSTAENDSVIVGRLRELLQSARDSEPSTLRLWQAAGAAAENLREGAAEASEAYPNLPSNMIYMRLSRPLLNRLVAREVNRQHAVSDFILGHYVTGIAQIRGRVDLVLLPSNHGGRAEIRLVGSSTSDTVAHAGPVEVMTHSITNFHSSKPVTIDTKGIVALPAKTVGETQSTITGVESSLPGLRGRVAKRIGTNRALESQPQSRAIALQKTTQHVSRHFDESVKRRFGDSNDELLKRIERIRKVGELVGYGMEFSTTGDRLELVVLGPVTEQSSLVAAPATSTETPDIEINIHAALVSRLLNDAELRGRLRPLLELLTASQNRAFTTLVGFAGLSAEDQYAARWSDDRNWFTLAWSHK